MTTTIETTRRYYHVRHDAHDGGPSYYVSAADERSARRAARRESVASGWRVGSVECTEIAPADMPQDPRRILVEES